MTHRQFLAWQAFDSFNRPSRTDYYLMQLAGIVLHIGSSEKGWKPSDYKIQFTRERQEQGLTKEQADRYNVKCAAALAEYNMGLKRERNRAGKDGSPARR